MNPYHVTDIVVSSFIAVLVIISTLVVILDTWRNRHTLRERISCMPLIGHCKKHGTRWCWGCFGFTMGFPAEHFLWHFAPVFAWISNAFGLA